MLARSSDLSYVWFLYRRIDSLALVLINRLDPSGVPRGDDSRGDWTARS